MDDEAIKSMCVVIVVVGGLWAEASDVPFEFEKDKILCR